MNQKESFKVGRYTITPFSFGTFRLDGGSMFGSVPKNLWSKRISPDNENCIPLACRSLLLQDDARSILIDVGIGNKWSDKLRSIYDIALCDTSSLPFQHHQITDVILTHLHFDHAGGISHYNDGKIELTYPDATIHLQTANWDRAQAPTPKDKASYLSENVEPLRNANLQLCDGTVEILPQILVHRVDGHTPGQQWVEIGDDNETLMFATDVIPTSHHVPLAFHMGYDVCADTLLREKYALLDQAVIKKAQVWFQHDTVITSASITRTDRGDFCCS
jgi:glyoxylase-like metal-dependent hydrolase (beta-lactamase superfamily II)